jgi:hypothetical protein
LSDELVAKVGRLQRQHAAIAAGWQEVARTRRQRSRMYGPLGRALALGLIVVVLTAATVPAYLQSRGLLAKSTLDWLAPTGTYGLFGLGMAAITWWHYARSRRDSRGGAADVVDAPLPVAAVDRALAEADRELRAVRLARFAEARLTRLDASSRSGAGQLDLIVIGSIAGPVGLAALWFSVEMVNGGEPYDAGVWLLWLICTGGAGLLVFLRARRGTRRRLVQQALAHLAGHLTGRRHEDHGDTVAWLNSHWAAATEDDDFYAGPRHASAAGTQLGYPVMIDFEPDGFTGEDVSYRPRVVLYLAALLPARPPPGNVDRARQLRASIQRAGFALEVDADAGWTARATPQAVALLRRDLSRLAEIRPVLADLGALAQAEGAIPA